MNITPTPLPGVLIVEPRQFCDERGYFMETFNARRFAAAGLPMEFPQDNLSHSVQGVLRGLHYQLRRPQGKLVHALRGEIYDVVVDIRRGSPTFGQWFGKYLSDRLREFLWIPAGFAHGFCVVSQTADVQYKVTDVYEPDDDHGVIWSDPMLAIDWPTQVPILSPKDQQYNPLDPSRPDLPEFHP